MSIASLVTRLFSRRVNARSADPDSIAVISRGIYDEDRRRPTFVYREAPLRAHDSGWALTLGETFPTDPGQPQPPLDTAHLRHLADRWPELRIVFADHRIESSWEWDESVAAYREVQRVGDANWA
jgi:hypothetical protein